MHVCVRVCGGDNLLPEKCGYGLPTDAGYAPFYAGLLFPFYGSNEIAYRFKLSYFNFGQDWIF